jgi:hypothetical protein
MDKRSVRPRAENAYLQLRATVLSKKSKTKKIKEMQSTYQKTDWRSLRCSSQNGPTPLRRSRFTRSVAGSNKSNVKAHVTTVEAIVKMNDIFLYV